METEDKIIKTGNVWISFDVRQFQYNSWIFKYRDMTSNEYKWTNVHCSFVQWNKVELQPAIT